MNVSSALLERDAKGSAPTAFRIWKPGVNATDHVALVFSPRSAKLILEEQARRGNLFSIDYDHLSLAKDRPATAGQAAGWHRLEVRESPDGPELWAVDVEWCQEARAGLEEQPPRWRYFSPAFVVDPETKEVVSYLNTALCINPATWHNNALAIRATRTATMKKAAMLAALKAMAASDGDDDQKKCAAALYAAMGGDDALKTAEGEDDDDKKDGETTKTSEDGEDDAPKSEDKPTTTTSSDDDDKPKTPYETKAATRKSKADPNVDIAVRVAKLEAVEAQREVSDLIAQHADRFTPALRDWALEQSVETVRSFIKKAPKQNLAAPKVQTATRGADAGKDKSKTSETTAAVEADVDRALGIRSGEQKPGFSEVREGLRILTTMTPSEARTRAGKTG